MMRLLRASAVVGLVLLTSVTMAYAECSWVIWMEVNSYNPGSTPIGAEGSQRDCYLGIERKMTELRAAGKKVEGDTLVLMGNDGPNRLRYFCLPDTVDPRGPKRP